MASRKSSPGTSNREANVLLEFRMVDPMSEEVLDANSQDVIDAAIDHAADLALGPALSVNSRTCSIKLRFDVLAKDDAEIYEQVSKVVAIVIRETDLELVLSRSSVEAQGSVDLPSAKFAAA